LLGALPQLGDHDDRAQRRHRSALREAALRARHRPLASRQAALARPRPARELVVGQADVLPVRPWLLRDLALLPLVGARLRWVGAAEAGPSSSSLSARR